jgi:5-methyltetrahydrofolate--homocysteine methyltransferase
MKLLSFIKKNRLYLDGGIGSSLIGRGIRTDDALNINIEQKQAVKEIHQGFVNAGTNLVLSNSFSLNGYKYSDTAKLKKAIFAARDILKEIKAENSPKRLFFGYDLGPSGALIEPYSNITTEEIYESYRRTAQLVAKAGFFDCVFLETFIDCAELKQAILAFKENTKLPVFASMSFQENGRTFTGASVASFALTTVAAGADVIGINCSLGAEQLIVHAKELLKYSSVPVFIKPNAGMPKLVGGKTVYGSNPEAFSAAMREIASQGVNILGGCCGTDDKYIKALFDATCDLPVKKFGKGIDAVAGTQSVFDFSKFAVIGERLNPTGKKLLKEAIVNGDYDYITALAVEQKSAGADILDINAGIPGVDETAKLRECVKKASFASGLPIQIDSGNPAAQEASLRAVCGVPIINSVTAEDDKLNAILPLAKKYGAYVIGLTLDENGIPKTAAERLLLASKIVNAAKIQICL